MMNGYWHHNRSKATGKYKTWYNIRGENNEERSIDLGSLEWERIPETEINLTYTDSRTSEDKDIITPKENELSKLAQFETYEEVLDCGQRTLST